MYAGVPHYSVIFSPFFTILPTPKSHILTRPLESSSMLSSLMSLCRMLLLWQYASDSTIYLKRHLARSSLRRRRLRT